MCPVSLGADRSPAVPCQDLSASYRLEVREPGLHDEVVPLPDHMMIPDLDHPWDVFRLRAGCLKTVPRERQVFRPYAPRGCQHRPDGRHVDGHRRGRIVLSAFKTHGDVPLFPQIVQDGALQPLFQAENHRSAEAEAESSIQKGVADDHERGARGGSGMQVQADHRSPALRQ